MNKAIFQNHQKAVASILSRCNSSLDIAVCWFSHPLFFSILLKKVRMGVRIRLIVQFDQANFHPKGLPFKQLVKDGGAVFCFRQNGLLHHKFMIVDGQRLLNGSYNWTGTNNADNLIYTDNVELVVAFQNEFCRLLTSAESFQSLAKIRPPAPGFLKLFEPVSWEISDLRHAIIWGGRVWISVYKENEKEAWEYCLKFQRHFLKIQVDYFDRNNAVWDEADFKYWSTNLSLTKKRLLNNYCIRTRQRDVIVAVSETGQFLAAGLIGADPEPGIIDGYCFSRFVQWFEYSGDEPLLEKVPKTIFTSYKESGLELVSYLTNRRAA